MKTTKKLELQAQTVRILNPADLQSVVGGKTTAITCGCTTTATCTTFTTFDAPVPTTAIRCSTRG